MDEQAVPRLAVSVKEGAVICGISEREMRDRISNREIETVRFGRRVLLSVTGLRDFVARHTVPVLQHSRSFSPGGEQ